MKKSNSSRKVILLRIPFTLSLKEKCERNMVIGIIKKLKVIICLSREALSHPFQTSAHLRKVRPNAPMPGVTTQVCVE